MKLRVSAIRLVWVLAGCLMTTSFCATAEAQVIAGDHIAADIQTPRDYLGLGEGGGNWYFELQHPEATYIAIHFVDFELADGDYLFVSDPSGDQMYVLEGRGKMNAGTFWAQHIKGDTAILELVQTSDDGGKGFIIDEYVAGFLDVSGSGLRAICGTDDKENAACYETSHPTQYERGRAVARLLSNGSAFCTGWLVSYDNHLITNEHCISSASAALDTDYEFMSEAPNCSDTNCSECFPGDIYSGATFIQDDANLDYCLVQITSGNPASAYGFLELDDRVAIVGEQIYIPQHPGGRAKEFSIYSTHAEDTGGVSQVHTIEADPCSGTGYYDVGYYADTEGGSSGSPVLAVSSHKVIALHHCANCPNRGVPIHLIHDEISQYLFPGPAGELTLDRTTYACDDTIQVSLKDGDLANNGSQAVAVVSAGGDAESVTLAETDTGSAVFEGSFQTETGTTVPGDGVLQVAHGQTITITYTDAHDGQGGINVPVVATAVIDCAAPLLYSVTTDDIRPRQATVSASANEPVLLTVNYGQSCSSLTETAVSAGYSTQAEAILTSLIPEERYYYAVQANDEAGNESSDDNGGVCYSFMTPSIPNFFTELFETASPNDLEETQLVFTPNGTYDYYSGCVEQHILSLPTDPSTGTVLSLTDDSFATITLTGGKTIPFYGSNYSEFFPVSNGYLTFVSGVTDYSETLDEHFSGVPKICALYDDLNPADGGTISWEQFSDRVVVTWDSVPQHSTSGDSNTFQIEMFFDGTITISYLEIGAVDGLAGLSRGEGMDPDFEETDLSAMSDCGPQRPLAFDDNVSLPANGSLSIELPGRDDGLPDPPAAVDYIITALPSHGDLSDPGSGAITAVPYILASNGNVVDYTPEEDYYGSDSLKFKLNDGGVAPDGGDSDEATISIGVIANPPTTQNVSVDLDMNGSATVHLLGNDIDGDDLDYTIMSLPQHGVLSDPSGGAITSTPYTLLGGGEDVLYTAEADYAGADVFMYYASDEIFNSTASTVSLQVIAPAPVITTSVLADGLVLESYGPVQLEVSGGQPSVQWQLVTEQIYAETDLGQSNFGEVGVAKGWHKDEGFWYYFMPFAFPFYGEEYSLIRIRPNGFIDFGSFDGSASENSVTSLINNRMIALLWDDLKTTGTGEDMFIDESVSGSVTIRWRASTYAGDSAVNISLTLVDDGTIYFDYGSGNANVAATVGVSDGDGVHYTVGSYDGLTDLGGLNSVRFHVPLLLPGGMGLSSTGILSGVPAETGDFEPVFKVTDSLGRSDQKVIALHITDFVAGDCDYDGDGDVDLADYAGFQSCYGDTGSPACSMFHSNDDGVIDLVDFAAFAEKM